jgi:prophage regulatory protein
MEEVIFWRLDKVLAETGLKRTHLYQMARNGEFPQQIKLGKRACAWLASEVQGWKKAKLRRHHYWKNILTTSQ